MLPILEGQPLSLAQDQTLLSRDKLTREHNSYICQVINIVPIVDRDFNCNSNL